MATGCLDGRAPATRFKLHEQLPSHRRVDPAASRPPNPKGKAPFVGTDNTQSMSLMVEYLCRSGEPPCYLDMPLVNRNAVERKAAYLASMERLGKLPVIVPIASRTWDFEAAGYGETARVLEKGGFPTRTVLCANDRIAFGVMAAAYQRRMRIGREPGCDLRVAGHDDHPLS